MGSVTTFRQSTESTAEVRAELEARKYTAVTEARAEVRCAAWADITRFILLELTSQGLRGLIGHHNFLFVIIVTSRVIDLKI